MHDAATADLPHRIHYLALEYPEAWAVSLSPHAAAAEGAVAAWLRRCGVLTDARGERVFRDLSVAGYGGWPFPRAAHDRLETVMGFLALWIFYDDRIEGQGEPRERDLRAALRGKSDAAVHNDPCLHGWWELARRYRPVMSAAWLDRLSNRFIDWARSVRAEAAQVARLRADGVHPSVAEYLAVREVSVGLLPTLCFLEYDLGLELPAALHEHTAMQELCRLAAWAVALFNDIYGCSKDERAGWVNAVASIRGEEARDLPAAFARAVALHNRCAYRLLAVEAQLLAAVPNEPLLPAWLKRLHRLVPGLARWQIDARRYGGVCAVSPTEEVRLRSPWDDARA